MNGTVGERCDIVKHFTDKILEDIPDAEIIFWDERLSTVAADRYLLEADVSRAKTQKKLLIKWLLYLFYRAILIV